MYYSWFFLLFFVIVLVAVIRTYTLLPNSNSWKRRERRSETDTCSIAIFLGSGGHTSEAISLLSSLDVQRYTPRKYIISEHDDLSGVKALEFEKGAALKNNLSKQTKSFEIHVVPRARKVHQPLITTPFTAFWSLISALELLLPERGSHSFSDVLLLNGPGTCFILCIAVYILRFFGIPTPRLVYVESFARVNKLSLSGKLLRPVVDRFVVQWPQLLKDGKRGECHGWLV